MRFLIDLDHWQEIKATLLRNRLRTLLTAFGVFWGIFLLMVMLGSGAGLRNGVMQGFAGTATNSFFVWTQRTQKAYAGLPAGRRVQLTNADVVAIREKVPEAEVVAPRNQLGGFGGGNNVTRGRRSGAFSVMGDHPEIQRIQSLRIDGGRFLNPLDVEETRKVYDLVREMRAQGLAVLMISHNMNHVFEHADRITVMKTGRVVGTRRTVETSHEEILRMIVTGSMQPTPSSDPTGRQTLRAVG